MSGFLRKLAKAIPLSSNAITPKSDLDGISSRSTTCQDSLAKIPPFRSNRIDATKVSRQVVASQHE